MTLGEMLEELREGILHDYSDQISGEPDYLWSDTKLVRYIDQAQRRLAREGFVLRDGALSTPGANATYGTQSTVTQVTLQTGVNMYPLHPSVIGVVSAQLAGDAADLARAGHSFFQTYRQPDTYFFDPTQLASLPPGKPLAFGTDEFFNSAPDGTLSQVVLRTYPVISADYNNQIVNLRIVRMPLERLAVKNLTAVPEVPEEHHFDMLDWAAYLALRKVDTDANFQPAAMQFKASFEDTVKKAYRLFRQKTLSDPKFAFGRNGFSYTGN